MSTSFKTLKFNKEEIENNYEKFEVPNKHNIGDTWNCEHLDKFLAKSSWTVIPSTANTKLSKLSNTDLYLKTSTAGSKPETEQSKLRKSFFF